MQEDLHGSKDAPTRPGGVSAVGAADLGLEQAFAQAREGRNLEDKGQIGDNVQAKPSPQLKEAEPEGRPETTQGEPFAQYLGIIFAAHTLVQIHCSGLW